MLYKSFRFNVPGGGILKTTKKFCCAFTSIVKSIKNKLKTILKIDFFILFVLLVLKYFSFSLNKLVKNLLITQYFASNNMENNWSY